MSDQSMKKQLAELQDWQLVAFSAALSERMFPNFALFSRLVEFGNAQQLRQILNGVWDKLGNTGAKMNFEVQLDKVEANIPDLEEFTMYGALPANDAVVALFSTLNIILAADPEEAANVALLSRECVASFIEISEADDQLSDEEVVRLINTHEMMEQEEAFQEEVLERVTASKKPNKDLIAALRELAHNEGFSNIGITDSE
ncbi:YjaG family protein [Pontibacterium granulatum]|uniref:YjaG family protein n=1 Tax=Pontibacterium granulatum TaxID=2036029 RepID=UPI00249C94A5|nr:YjaG family protein [Pontibacterium granulatum]MDI3326165.1 YjaG family protein [Pontibacterium granulatum]